LSKKALTSKWREGRENGIDNIDVDACTQKGIIVVNTPESNTMAAAELAIALAYCLFRNVPQVNNAVKHGDFRRNKFLGRELDGKVVGIIGLGRIGSIVARKMIGSNMKAIAYDPYITDDKFARSALKSAKPWMSCCADRISSRSTLLRPLKP